MLHSTLKNGAHCAVCTAPSLAWCCRPRQTPTVSYDHRQHSHRNTYWAMQYHWIHDSRVIFVRNKCTHRYITVDKKVWRKKILVFKPQAKELWAFTHLPHTLLGWIDQCLGWNCIWNKGKGDNHHKPNSSITWNQTPRQRLIERLHWATQYNVRSMKKKWRRGKFTWTHCKAEQRVKACMHSPSHPV